MGFRTSNWSRVAAATPGKRSTPRVKQKYEEPVTQQCPNCRAKTTGIFFCMQCGYQFGDTTGPQRLSNLQGETMRIRTIIQEPVAEKAKRLKSQQAGKELRSEKLQRTRHGGAQADVDSVNLFRDFGLDYLAAPSGAVAYQWLQGRANGSRVDTLSERALKFLSENFDVEQVEDSEGRILLMLKTLKEGHPMKVFRDVADEVGIPRKQVRAVYESLVSRIRSVLKVERRFRLPELGIISIKYRPAREKRRGINPFTKEKQWFKAKPASNKLRFRPAKELKKFVDKLPVIAPPKKKKKGKKGKR